MSDVIEHLKSFNRKERYWLLREIEGERAFSLGDQFRSRLSKVIGVSIPQEAHAWMDYHLDWIALALHLTKYGDRDELLRKQDVRGGDQFNSNQMDIDALIAFREGTKVHMVLLEAKLETGWNNDQLKEKINRLRQIVPDDARLWDESVEFHLVLFSPKESARIETASWAVWMTRPDGRPYWMRFVRPKDLRKATRSDVNGNPQKEGAYLRLQP